MSLRGNRLGPNLNTVLKTDRHPFFLPLIFWRATACNEQLHCRWNACIWNSVNYTISRGLHEDHRSFSLLKENTSPMEFCASFCLRSFNYTTTMYSFNEFQFFSNSCKRSKLFQKTESSHNTWKIVIANACSQLRTVPVLKVTT